MSSSLHTSGRGGAGNMTDGKATPVQPEDLQTPILKSNVVSTGRGGSGNIAANLDEEERRRRQDVTPVERGPHGAFNTGRGGAGNVVMEDKAPSSTDEKLEKKVTSTSIGRSPSPKTDKPEGKQSILDKAKNLFGKKDQQ